MICVQCGTSTQANTGFCPNCGATMTGAAPDPNGSRGFEAPPSSPSTMPPTTASALMPICNRRGVLRSSLPWIGLLIFCVTAGTIAVLGTDGSRASTQASLTAANAAASTPDAATPAAPAAPAPENRLARLAKITNVGEFVAEPEVAERLNQLLGSDIDEFKRDLSVQGSPNLDGDTITFTTCAAQGCGVSEAAISLNTGNGGLVAAILANNHIRIYGASTAKLEDCPTALQAWARKLAQGSSGNFTYEMRTSEPADGSAPARQ